MAFVDEIKAACVMVGHALKNFFSEDDSFFGRYAKGIGFLISFILFGLGSYFAYRTYIMSREQKAHYAFADCVQAFDSALKVDSLSEWERVSNLCGHGFVAHEGSMIAPLFLSYKADAQIKMGNGADAINTISRAMDLLSKESPFLYMLDIKRALVQIDSQDDVLKNKGIDALIAAGRNEKHAQRDMALFYLGRYYWSQDHIDEAKRIWQELVDTNWQDKAYPSPWVQEAKKQLKQFSS